MSRYQDRRHAGRVLAAALREYAGRPDVIVLALPRGGVPVAYEVATRLGLPLDVFVVRKLGVPGHEEFAMVAIESGGVIVLNRETIEGLRLPREALERVIGAERTELARREQMYRQGRPPLDVTGKTCVLIDAIAETAHPLVDSMEDLEPILELVGDARLVLIGEATHGTHDFYHQRAQLTQRLIVEKGFCAVAAEADWPDAYRVNRYVRGIGKDAEAIDALDDFKRFPAWMWRNADVLEFVAWLRDHNDRADGPTKKVGFYGLDLYSLHASITSVLEYLDKVDREAARRARYRYACFERFGEDPQAYGYATSFGMRPDCEREAVMQLVELRGRRQELMAQGGLAEEDEAFEAEQNANVVKNAEEYYRSMFEGRISSWNQ